MIRFFSRGAMPSHTDEHLMLRVARKDDDGAFNELHHRYARKLMGFFYRQMKGDEALASDMVQDVFLRVWSSRNQFCGDSFRVWLFSIAYNLCKNHYRHLAYEQSYVSEMTEYEEGRCDEIELHMDEDTFCIALQNELDLLEPSKRLLFSLRFEEELTIPQIASIIGIPEGTVKSRLFLLTQLLKKKFQHYDKF